MGHATTHKGEVHLARKPRFLARHCVDLHLRATYPASRGMTTSPLINRGHATPQGRGTPRPLFPASPAFHPTSPAISSDRARNLTPPITPRTSHSRRLIHRLGFRRCTVLPTLPAPANPRHPR